MCPSLARSRARGSTWRSCAAALAREGPLEYEGQEFRLPVDRDGLGKPLKLLVRPVQERIPIYLGAMGPKAVEQTARIADGWLPFMFDPDQLGPFRERERGHRAGGDGVRGRGPGPCP